MNGILLVDKPSDWTSHDVVAKLRGILRERRIGHSGTLDPMATGLLVIFIGRATRAVQFAEGHDKTYLAGLRTGISTDTQDITGTVLTSCDRAVTREELESVLPEFMGEIYQIPPMYSAVKVNGQKLYKLARSGIEIERKSRPITIKELSLLGVENGDYNLRITCSKGTYIRTLCHDIGEKLGTGAALSSLRRVSAGGYLVSDALTLEQIAELSNEGGIEQHLMPVDSLFLEYPAAFLDVAQTARCRCGNSFPFKAEDGSYRVYSEDGSFLMLGLVSNGIMSTVKSFFEI